MLELQKMAVSLEYYLLLSFFYLNKIQVELTVGFRSFENFIAWVKECLYLWSNTAVEKDTKM